MNESSAVSDIIQRMRSRRLETDPSDSLLFAPSTSAGPRKRPAQARWFDEPAPPPAPAPAPQLAARNPRAAKVVAPRSSDRSRIGLLIAAAIVAGGLGIYGASRLQIGDDAPAASMPHPALAITPPTLEATPPAPVEQVATPSAPVATTAQPTVPTIDTTAQPTVTAPVDTSAQPTVTPPVDTVAPTATPTPKHHRVVKRKKAKAKRVKASAKQAVAQPAEVAAPKPAKRARRAAQSEDSESPL